MTRSLEHDDNSRGEPPCSVRGEIRGLSGETSGGDEDLSVAEDYARKDQLSGTHKRDLEFHAELLQTYESTGRGADKTCGSSEPLSRSQSTATAGRPQRTAIYAGVSANAQSTESRLSDLRAYAQAAIWK